MSVLKSWDLWFLLSWRKILLILAVWVTCVVLHNAVYALFRSYWGPNGEEPFFFLLAVVVIPVYALIAVVHTVQRKLRGQS
jgi:hypothetical protein